MNQFKTIAFVAGQTPEAREACARLEKRYGNADPTKADVIVALGGDGLMLQTLHKFMKSGKPIYGMHRGTVGFPDDEFSEDKLAERLANAHITVIHPLLMRARDTQGRTHEHRAINEPPRVAVPAERAGFPPAHPDRRTGAARRAHFRRRAGRDAGRIDRV